MSKRLFQCNCVRCSSAPEVNSKTCIHLHWVAKGWKTCVDLHCTVCANLIQTQVNASAQKSWLNGDASWKLCQFEPPFGQDLIMSTTDTQPSSPDQVLASATLFCSVASQARPLSKVFWLAQNSSNLLEGQHGKSVFFAPCFGKVFGQPWMD